MLSEVLILLGAAVVAVALFRRLHLPPILGYLMVGIVVGPAGLGLVDESEHIHILSEMGVVFLLFAIGLELSIPQLLAMRRVVLGAGGAQVALTAAAAGLIAWGLGLTWQGSLIVGGMLAMSSTAVVVKQLTEQVELGSRHGRIALGVLLFQDIAVIPKAPCLPIWAGRCLAAWSRSDYCWQRAIGCCVPCSARSPGRALRSCSPSRCCWSPSRPRRAPMPWDCPWPWALFWPG
jgi:CPA2 family monovalent cation:H+ antiporter-2